MSSGESHARCASWLAGVEWQQGVVQVVSCRCVAWLFGFFALLRVFASLLLCFLTQLLCRASLRECKCMEWLPGARLGTKCVAWPHALCQWVSLAPPRWMSRTLETPDPKP